MLRLQEECKGLASPATSICILHSAVLMPSCHSSTFCCSLSQNILTFHRTAQVFVPPSSSTHQILLPVPFWLHSNGNAYVINFSVVICIYVQLNTCHLLWSVCVFVYGYFKWQACNRNMVESLSDIIFSWQSSFFWIERNMNNQRRSKKNQESVWLTKYMVNSVCVWQMRIVVLPSLLTFLVTNHCEPGKAV